MDDKTLDALRRALDEADRELIAGLEKRMALVREVAAYKRVNGLPILDAAREAEIYASRAEMVQDARNDDYINAFMAGLIGSARREQRRLYNVYLIGMPGAGKSYYARLIAATSELTLMDTDDMAVAMGGMSIPEIFDLRGEAGFRALERGALTECARRGGGIVATGGGILDEANTALMHASGRTVFLDRALDALLKQDYSGRPLINGAEDVKALYAKRHAAYLAAADMVLDPDAPDALQTLWDYCVE